MEDFYINDHGASEFGAMLLSSWYVSGSTLTQNYLTSYTGSRITFCSTSTACAPSRCRWTSTAQALPTQRPSAAP